MTPSKEREVCYAHSCSLLWPASGQAYPAVPALPRFLINQSIIRFEMRINSELIGPRSIGIESNHEIAKESHIWYLIVGFCRTLFFTTL